MKNNLDKHFGNVIHFYRIQHHMTQENLGELVDCSAGFIGQIERNESMPSVQLLINIVNVLNIDTNELFHFSKKITSEDEQLTHLLSHRLNGMSLSEKKFILSIIDNINLIK
jgi:transcriptional regulator with XRE-family HTH domain